MYIIFMFCFDTLQILIFEKKNTQEKFFVVLRDMWQILRGGFVTNKNI